MDDLFLKDLEELSDVEDTPHAQIDEDSDDLEDISKLQNSRRFKETVEKIDALRKEDEDEDADHEELIVECNLVLVEIEKEIYALHNYIRDRYRSRFPELESLVHQPIDYARVVQKIGNETDLTLIDVRGILPPAVVIPVSVMASSTSGKSLPEQVVQKIIHACAASLALDEDKEKILRFIERRMQFIAPNLTAVVGSGVAAKLMGAAGGLPALGSMPACNIQVLGGSKRKTFGLSSPEFQVGFIEEAEVFQSTPPSLRKRACRLIAAKSALASRVDCAKTDPMGRVGTSLREEIVKKIEKWQMPNPARLPKPLPVPDSEPKKKKRGGVRLRKMEERYGMTEVRKLRNRMGFGVGEESSLGDGFGHGYGMRNPSCRRLAPKVANKFKNKYSCASAYGIGGATSTLAFTPVQGIELVNPRPHDATAATTTTKYFF